jgi:6-phosphogluconolactonase
LLQLNTNLFGKFFMTLYIGTYTQTSKGGIYAASFDEQSGELGAVQGVAATPNPSFLAASPDGRFLYAVNEWGQLAGEDEGGLSSFQISRAQDELAVLNEIALGGTLCHLTVDTTGKWLLAAAYDAGTVSIWPLQADGSIGLRVGLIQHDGHGPNKNRQGGPHAHHIVFAPDHRRVFVADLGADKVMIYDFDAATGKLTPAATPSIDLASGAGPRHMALSQDGDFLYIVSELNNTVSVFKNVSSTPEQMQVVTTLPDDYAGESHTAEISIHPNGRFLYASNRGHDSLVGYFIEADGKLNPTGFSPTGRTPRHFAFAPSGKWLLAANQDDRSISIFEVDPHSGALTLTHKNSGLLDRPTCLLFLKL